MIVALPPTLPDVTTPAGTDGVHEVTTHSMVRSVLPRLFAVNTLVSVPDDADEGHGPKIKGPLGPQPTVTMPGEDDAQSMVLLPRS